MASTNGFVFVSCGQLTAAEHRLHDEIPALVRDLTPFEPYSAPHRATLTGVAEDIFRHLNESVALIAVMHGRGVVQTPDGHSILRTSVWVEQEIAVAAFLNQCYRPDFKIAAYGAPGIEREGVRDKLMVNPQIFTDAEAVLEDLRGRLPGWRNLPPPEGASLRLDLEHGELSKRRIGFRIRAYVRNHGSRRIEDYRLELRLPEVLVLRPTSHAAEDLMRSTATERVFVFPVDRRTIRAIPIRDEALVGSVACFVGEGGASLEQLDELAVHATLDVSGLPRIKRSVRLGDLAPSLWPR